MSKPIESEVLELLSQRTGWSLDGLQQLYDRFHSIDKVIAYADSAVHMGVGITEMLEKLSTQQERILMTKCLDLETKNEVLKRTLDTIQNEVLAYNQSMAADWDRMNRALTVSRIHILQGIATPFLWIRLKFKQWKRHRCAHCACNLRTPPKSKKV